MSSAVTSSGGTGLSSSCSPITPPSCDVILSGGITPPLQDILTTPTTANTTQTPKHDTLPPILLQPYKQTTTIDDMKKTTEGTTLNEKNSSLFSLPSDTSPEDVLSCSLPCSIPCSPHNPEFFAIGTPSANLHQQLSTSNSSLSVWLGKQTVLQQLWKKLGSNSSIDHHHQQSGVVGQQQCDHTPNATGCCADNTHHAPLEHMRAGTTVTTTMTSSDNTGGRWWFRGDRRAGRRSDDTIGATAAVLSTTRLSNTTTNSGTDGSSGSGGSGSSGWFSGGGGGVCPCMSAAVDRVPSTVLLSLSSSTVVSSSRHTNTTTATTATTGSSSSGRVAPGDDIVADFDFLLHLHHIAQQAEPQPLQRSPRQTLEVLLSGRSGSLQVGQTRSAV
eukprot:GHVS01081810.1.p1 GENE.GHVS01081810.1~~GHVS01081810.1.p1  ORF type:complete len:387 (-),score=142.20 GHVS01081810.1:338-1498(-)